MEKITCVIIDDEKGPRERLAILLSKIDGVNTIGIEESPEIAISSIIKKGPDIVFVDVEMPRLSGFDVVKQVRKERPSQCFIFVTGYNQYAIKAIKSEAFDYLLKPVDIDELADTVKRFISKGGVTTIAINKSKELINLLSIREKEILKYISQFKTATQIAEILHISKHTVDTHRRNILNKLDMNSSSELIVFCREAGIG